MHAEGATALITGGAKRIGRAISLALADAGSNVIIHCNKSRDAAESTSRECRERGVSAHVIAADLSTPDGPDELWHAVLRISDAPPNILINNASHYQRETFAEPTAASWDTAMAVNLRAPYILAQRMCNELARCNAQGCVINMNDCRRYYQTRWTYGVTVGALSALTNAMARGAPPGFRVNELRLGPTMPPEISPAQRDPASTPIDLVPIDDVTNAILRLIRDDSANGASIAVLP